MCQHMRRVRRASEELRSRLSRRAEAKSDDSTERDAKPHDATERSFKSTGRGGAKSDDECSDEEPAVGLPAFPDHSAEDKRSQGWSRSVDVGDGTRRWGFVGRSILSSAVDDGA